MSFVTVKHFDSFNRRRYSDPWVALSDSNGSPDFSHRAGYYTGGFRTGDAGDLVILDPVEGAVYTWGQKDFRGGNTERGWCVYRNGALEPVTRTEAVALLNPTTVAEEPAEAVAEEPAEGRHEMLNQTFGVEVEMYHITRGAAALALVESLNRSTGRNWVYHHTGGSYDAWEVHPVDASAPKWLLESDSSIIDLPTRRVELVTPVLTWDAMPALQQALRDLRKAGARSDPEHMCGIHVHIGAEGHTPKTLRNLANIMASHEYLLTSALALDRGRVQAYAKPVDPTFLAALNREKPATMEALSQIWYSAQGGTLGRTAHYHPSRYHMLNLHSLFTGKGLEFRLFQFDRYDTHAPKGHRGGIHAGQLKAFVQLCLALSYRAKVTRSASPRVLQTDNPRYAMRCWLLRLGFIGDDFATARSVFTNRLEGDSSFRHGRPRKEAAVASSEPADAGEASVVIDPAHVVGGVLPMTVPHILAV